MNQTKITIEEALQQMPELLRTLCNRQEVVVMDGDEEVVRLTGERHVPVERHPPGFAKHMMKILDDSDDVILDTFSEYLS